MERRYYAFDVEPENVHTSFRSNYLNECVSPDHAAKMRPTIADSSKVLQIIYSEPFFYLGPNPKFPMSVYKRHIIISNNYSF